MAAPMTTVDQYTNVLHLERWREHITRNLSVERTNYVGCWRYEQPVDVELQQTVHAEDLGPR